jgi:uncharacterized protein YecT (DUF1311 family)
MFLLQRNHLQALAFFILLIVRGASATDCDTYSCKENARLANELQKADRQLNNEYKSIVQKLNPLQKSSLARIQREWINFRDKTCEEYAEKSCEECDFTTSAQIQKQANDELQCSTLLTKIRTHEFEEIKKTLAHGNEPNFLFKPEVPTPLR